MDKTLFGVENLDSIVVLGILVLFGLMEAIGGLHANTKRSKDDWLVETLGFVGLVSLIKPGIVLSVILIGQVLLPESAYVFKGMNFWLALPIYLLIDDLLQYWYHRSAHEYEFLWKLHRPHHAAEEMGILVSYRNAFLYYILMPNIWWVGIVTLLGGGQAVALGLILKQMVIISSHSPTKWDQYLYNNKWLNPLAWVVERIIVTPATHHAHHGRSKVDGISDPNGNFGNMFFIWDQLFGTALITRQYPEELGLPNDPKDSWSSHLLYPFVKSKKAGSEISAGFKKEKNTSLEPVHLELEAGTYLWCQCGYSKDQPFCDGSHHGTKHKPLVFEVKKKVNVKLCACKHTKIGPFCDNSHLEFIPEEKVAKSSIETETT